MLRWLGAACLVLVCAVSAAAQSVQVTGTVVDEQGAGVPGATISLTGPASRSFATSGAGGAYVFANVAPGTYELTATVVGFAQATSGNIVVGSTSVAAPALTLRIASLSDTVVVSATKTETALVDAPATMSVLTSTEIQNSPAQNYGDLLRSVP